ncbi:general substrate transporter [Meredithblackwellia eburnea MCA 4105]
MSSIGLNEKATGSMSAIEHYKTPSPHSPQRLQSMPMPPSPADLELGVQLAEAGKTAPVWKSIKKEWRIIGCAWVYLFACIGQGFDSGATAITPTMPAFLMQFGAQNPTTHSLYVPSLWLSLWTAFTSAGIAIGALSAGFLLDRFGPRKVMAFGNFWMLASIGLQVASKTRVQLFMGKFFGGVPQGIFMTTAASYISEIASTRLRAPLITMIPMTGLIGVIFSVGLGVRQLLFMDKWHSYGLMFALQWLLPILTLSFLLVTPDSPVYLVKQSRPEDALEAYKKLYGPATEATELRAHLARTQLAVAHELEQSEKIGNPSFLECFRGTDRIRTLTVMGIFIVQQCAGIAFGALTIYFLSIQGLPFSEVFDVSTGFLAIGVFANVVSAFIVEKFGRRRVFVYGSILHMGMLFTIGAMAYVKTSGGGWALSILLNLSISTQQITTGGPGYSLSAEISSIRLRAKTQSLGMISFFVSSWVFQFATPYMYQTAPGSAGLGAKTGFVYGGLTFLCIIWAFFYIPETHKRSFSDIDALYERKVAPRKFSDVKDLHTERDDIA